MSKNQARSWASATNESAAPLRRCLAIAAACVGMALGSCGGGGSESEVTQTQTRTTAIPVGNGAVLLVMDTFTSKAESSQARRQAAAPNPLPPGTIVLPVEANVLTHVRAYTFVNPLNCAYIENGSFTIVTAPSRGDLQLTSDEEIEYTGGCPGKYKSGVARYIWKDGTAVPGAAGSVDFFALHFATTSGSAAADTNWLAVLANPIKVTIRLPNGIDVTNNAASPQSVVVGQKIDLVGWVENVPANTPVSSRLWTIESDGVAVGGFNPDRVRDQLLPLKVDDAALTFYWIAPSRHAATQQKVVFTARTADGKTVSAETWFRLLGPEVTPVVPGHGALPLHRISPGDKISVGKGTGSDAGIYAAHPAVPPPGLPGQSIWVQVIEDHIQLLGGAADWTCDVGPKTLDLDKTFPTWVGWMADSPSVPILDQLRFTRDFSARSYAMWSSGLPGAIPVPLGYIDWGFTHIGLRSTQRDQFETYVIGYTATPLQRSLEFPQWSAITKSTDDTCVVVR